MDVKVVQQVYDVEQVSKDTYNVRRYDTVYDVQYTPYAVIGVNGGAADTVFGEVPSGAINGTNATFTTEFDFVPETVQVILNGMIQKRVQDYNTSGTQTITLNVSPTSGETLTINYQRA